MCKASEENRMKLESYIITCPECQAVFDCSKELKKWKQSLLHTSKVLDQIEQLNKNGGKHGNTK